MKSVNALHKLIPRQMKVDESFFNINLKVFNHLSSCFGILQLESCKINVKKRCPMTYERTCISQVQVVWIEKWISIGQQTSVALFRDFRSLENKASIPNEQSNV